MKVLVTGVKGQLGHDVMNELAKRGYEGVGAAPSQCRKPFPRHPRHGSGTHHSILTGDAAVPLSLLRP